MEEEVFHNCGLPDNKRGKKTAYDVGQLCDNDVMVLKVLIKGHVAHEVPLLCFMH